MSRRRYLNTSQPVSLTADVTGSAASLPVTSTAGYPPVPFTIGMDRGTIDEEVCLVTAIPDGTHFTATRGYDGTTQKIHNAGHPVEHCVIAMDYDEANAHVNDASLHSFPTGLVVPYAGATAPTGWLLCDGSAVSRTTYAALHTLLKDAAGANTYPYGAGDGSTTFALPDLRGRFPLGKDNMGGTSANRVLASQADALGQGSGAETVTVTINEMPSHTHVQNSHTHTQNPHTHIQNAHFHAATGDGLWQFIILGPSGAGASDSPGGGAATRGQEFSTANTTPTNQSTTATNNATTATNQNTGGGNPVNKMPPYLTLNYIVKT